MVGILTDDDIRKDIKGFEKRIQDAKAKLSELPVTASTWQARKKLKEKRRIFILEIEHVHRLVSMAEEAIADV
jgi:hypothetical protein